MMKNFYAVTTKFLGILSCTVCLLAVHTPVKAQKATVAIPVAIGSPCGATGTSKDSVKYFNYNSTTNVLNKRYLCQPSLATPGFGDVLATTTYNPYDGYLYFMQIASVSGIYNTYTYKWLPTTCPTGSAAVSRTFANQFVAGVEFDPATGLGYQINFVDTTGWAPSAIDETGTVGQYASHAVVDGSPAVAYYDATNKRLKYIRANENGGTSWPTAITVSATTNVGTYASLFVVNGNPAIAYYDAGNKDLKYVRATDVDGNSWGTPVTVEATNDVGMYASMVVVNGNPAIAYYDNTNGDLRYIRSTDVNGASWGTPVNVESTNNVGQYPSLWVVNGNPAIAFYDVTNGDLRYKRATDASGTTWGTAVNVEATNNVGQYPSLYVVNGYPAISFYDVSNGDLRYKRATDANGAAAWGTAVNISSAGNVGLYTSMLIVDGNPAISYYDATNKDLKFVRSNDASGAAWATPVTPEATGDVGQYSSMIIANGNPAIAYFDNTNSDLRFIRAYDNDGTMWYKNSGVYNMEMQQVNFTTGALNNSYPIDFGGRHIYVQTGDMVMTPGGNLLAVYNNKYFTVNWQDYSSATPLVATYIDTLQLGAGNNLVGLSYSDGKLVGSISTASCPNLYKQLDILTGAMTPINYGDGGTIFNSTDMTNITSGVGSAKKLISATENPVGSKTYDVVYEVVIKNYGNTPVTNVQAYDTLTYINGAANMLSASITSFTAPAGITKNAAYDGKTAGKFNLLTAGGTLSNITGQNTITLQITCKIANISQGVVYNNQAWVTATGLLGDALRDASTDGSNPDLNQNDKPDDAAESQPTPFLIAVIPQTPPCSSLTNILYTQDFGSGTGLVTAIPAPVLGTGATLGTGTTGYTGSVTQPIPDETYTITNNAQNANTTRFISLTDHTGNTNGRMLVVNADAASSNMYRATFTTSLCAGQQYSLSFYAAFIGNPAYRTICDAFGGFKYPKIKMRVLDGTTGLVISQVSTTNITNQVWQQYGFKFVTPTSFNNIIIELVNDAPGGCGNDIALDDIQFGTCDALPNVSVSTTGNIGCIGSSATFTSTLSDPTALPGSKDYQWQYSPAPGTGPWVDILGATSANYTINPITAADTGRYYRVLVAATGNIASPSCRYTSPGQQLIGKAPSVAATSAKTNKSSVCPGITATLSVVGGSLGANASWKWYTGSCGGTLVGTGASITVTPLVTTTYYVRAEGDCNVTACQAVTITISCNIDKDKDGIPDWVESNFPAAFLDANSNGILDAYDAALPGYVDNNNDFINDNFQADGDSDGDGILNYLDTDFPGRVDTNGDGIDDRFDKDLDGKINMLDLDSDNDGIPDVVEAYGVDANGDGLIDNYSDTDGDGLSQNVDGNNTGAYNSGVGLGRIDFDGDNVPNEFDLDSDNDGIPDLLEAGGADTDNNGKVDVTTDANANGWADIYEGTAKALLRTGADTNNDGTADSYPYQNMDADAKPSPYDMDSDGDGIVDVIEAGLPDANIDGVVDGTIAANGWSTSVSSMSAPLALRKTDGDAKPDYLDIDSDNDGIPDNIEGQTTNGYLLPGTTDSDGDGLVDTYDNVAGFGGGGIHPVDTDGDNIPDYRDTNSDGDALADVVEGNDFNFNRLPDDLVTLTNVDTDNDGLDDRFDVDNTSANGTSAYMGNSGSFTGSATPGSKTVVQSSFVGQSNRDWRYVGAVLPVEFVNFSGILQGNNVPLNWKIIAQKEIDHFEVERSLDNSTYTKAGTVTGNVQLNVEQAFGFVDDVSALSNEVIYYRLKVIGKAGEIKYSNVLVIRRSQTKTPVKIMPNPASDYVSVRFFAEKESEVSLRLIDNIGKTVFIEKHKVMKGINILQVNNLNKYSNGVYTLQVMVNDEVVNQKLVLAK